VLLVRTPHTSSQIRLACEQIALCSRHCSLNSSTVSAGFALHENRQLDHFRARPISEALEEVARFTRVPGP